jgi:uncharacterized protein YaaW (UPF0174 family)
MKNPVFDKDLTPLLRRCDSSDLDPIVELILSAPSQTLAIKPAYREHPGDHRNYVDEIVYEITSFGGNSLANLVRGHGVPYSEMVRDVAGKMMIKPSVTDTTSTLEEKIILKILKLSYDRMDQEDRIALGELVNLSVKVDGNGHDGAFPEDQVSASLSTTASSLAGDRIQNAIEIAARSARVRQTLISAGRSVIAKFATASLGGPISWAVAAGQAIFDLFGPNNTRALGLIAQIGLLRQKYQQMKRDVETDGIAEEMELLAAA